MKDLEGIKRELKRQIDTTEALISAWENVERVHRKNGEDFQSFGRNFVGCEYGPERTAWYADDTEISVSDFSEFSGYVRDSIARKALVKYSYIKPSPDRIMKHPGMESYFLLSVDEMETAIAQRVASLKERLCSLRSQFILADKAYNQFTEAVDNALRDLKGLAGERTSLYYACRDYLTGVY